MERAGWSLVGRGRRKQGKREKKTMEVTEG
jgi:hypothetical protein